MSSRGDLTKDARHHARDAARPWMERLARLGYATEGAVYSLIGLLAAGAAFGTDVRAFGERVGYGASALNYAGLAFSTVGQLLRYRHIITYRVE